MRFVHLMGALALSLGTLGLSGCGQRPETVATEEASHES